MATKRTPPKPNKTQWEWTWHWRSVAAVVYLAICATDFLVMPIYREYSYTRMPISEMVAIARKMDDSATQVEALRVLKEDRPWTPITNEMFHIAFGAILGVAALPTNRGSFGGGGYGGYPSPLYPESPSPYSERTTYSRTRRYDEAEGEGLSEGEGYPEEDGMPPPTGTMG